LTDDSNELEKTYHETVKKVTHDFKNLHFNTGISQLMMFVNEAYKAENLNRHYIEGFVKVLSPVAPHLAEELWERLGYQETIAYESWPTYDESKHVETEVEIVIQVIGKVRSKIKLDKDIGKEELEKLAQEEEKNPEWTEEKKFRIVIVTPGKLVNIVTN